VPLIGFSGSPWTLACYMVEGGGSDDYRLVKTMLYGRPDLMHRILDVNAEAVTAYLNAQIDAGAQAVMVFDSWGGVLADGAFQRFSLDYTRRVVAGLKREKDGQRIPVIVFTKGGGPWLEEIAAAAPTWWAWTGRSTWARRARGGQPRGAAGQPRPQRAVRAARGGGARGGGRARQLRPPQRADGGWDGHIFNLGHGISQHTPPEHVTALVEAVHATRACGLAACGARPAPPARGVALGRCPRSGE
jgi:uroporphyrinogen decarboxylase